MKFPGDVIVVVTPGVHIIAPREPDDDQGSWRALCGAVGGAFGSPQFVTCPQCRDVWRRGTVVQDGATR